MKLIEWKLSCLQSIDRFVRTSLAFKMRLSLVLVICFVIIISVICPPANLSQPNGQTASSMPVAKANHHHPSHQRTTAPQSNLTQLKHAIKSIRQQKRNIILSQLRNHRSIEQAQLNFTKLEMEANNSAATPKVEPHKLSPDKDLAKYIENGIFWSAQIESIIPKGFTYEDDLRWMNSLRHSSVFDVTNGCGRMQNRLLKLTNGEKACVRYRKNNDQIQGEFLSFLLARILQIGNVPSSALVPSVFGAPPKESSSELRWDKVQAKLKQAQWESKPVVLTRFIEKLEPAFIPSGLRSSHKQLHPVAQDISHLSTGEIIELVQWSDLIVLDYLTANLDRMINNMINERWNPQMMDSPAHNLLRHKSSNLLLFIDNESGLFHGYRLLSKFQALHRSLLKSLCVFRQSTVEQLEKLHSLSDKEFSSLLKSQYRKYVLGQPLEPFNTILPKSNALTLRKRMSHVLDQVRQCRSQFGSRSQ